ncbi:hypothetical protein FRB90_000767 [Tulasnella sp. 427]|nr:hypothetical protein FRB90_000767 [Tulasnella sp. 427]
MQAIYWDGDLGDEFRKLLQAQPMLEELVVPSSLAFITFNSLMTKLQPSDISNLRSLHADPFIALAFLPVATRLDSLSVSISEDWFDQFFSRLQTALEVVGPCLLRFSIVAWYETHDRRWVWDNLDKIFGLFPNLEKLCITIGSMTSAQNVPHAGYYFSKVAGKIHLLPSLQSLDVSYETLYPETPGIFSVEKESVVGLKASCPLLESVIDPQRRLWTFATPYQGPSGLSPYLVEQLIEEDQEYLADLPDPECIVESV